MLKFVEKQRLRYILLLLHTIFSGLTKAMKFNSHLAIVIFGLLLVFSSFEIEARMGSLIPPQCDPKFKGAMPDAIKNLCKSVAKLWEMSNDMEDDLDQNGKNFNI